MRSLVASCIFYTVFVRIGCCRHKRIYWTIEWVFPESNKKNIYDHRIPSSQPLRQSLSTRLATSLDLNPYHAHGATGCFVMLKREHMPANHPPTFVDLTPYLDRALVEALRGEAVIEFPTLYVWTARPTEGVVVEEKVEIAAVKAEEKGRQEAGIEGKEEEGEAEGEEEEMEEEAEQVEQGEGEGDGNVVVVDLDLEKMLDALNNDLGGVRESEAE
ncbi:hypothetical protein BC938DRAFT_474604 [Jimgerdemannia flammicorona]|uniref:BCD1 alpha/beta domain-containing protein n=1 Tax=Jimgerdemannia flammicorona TaxID=994334 RepID=A0A433Q1Y3_9FUNG|nr:hypothetical protein BC938DRAFT_474604 [Jimgerdemannia flammicorona]